MERYVYRRRLDGIYVINLGKTWEKLQLAARIIVAIENPQDIVVQSARPYGQRAVLKFAQYTGAKALAGRHTPGTYQTNCALHVVQACKICCDVVKFVISKDTYVHLAWQVPSLTRFRKTSRSPVS